MIHPITPTRSINLSPTRKLLPPAWINKLSDRHIGFLKNSLKNILDEQQKEFAADLKEFAADLKEFANVLDRSTVYLLETRDFLTSNRMVATCIIIHMEKCITKAKQLSLPDAVKNFERLSDKLEKRI